MGPAHLLVSLLVASLAAGCIDAAEPPAGGASGDASSAPPAVLPAFELAGTACREGGGHSVHPRSVAGEVPLAEAVPKPWMVADVLADVGPQATYSEVPDPMHPVPTEGETWGNIHMTLVCDAWTFNGEDKPGLAFGYVGAKVETPPFAAAGPTHEYIVTVVASDDEDVVEALHAAGIHAMRADATFEMDDTMLSTVLATDGHGTYESRLLLEDLGEMTPGPIRLWFQSENEDGTFAPVALDMVHTAGGRHFGARAQGYFSHTGTDMHGPQGGTWGHTAGLAYSAFDRTITLGARPSLALSAAYVH